MLECEPETLTLSSFARFCFWLAVFQLFFSLCACLVGFEEIQEAGDEHCVIDHLRQAAEYDTSLLPARLAVDQQQEMALSLSGDTVATIKGAPLALAQEIADDDVALNRRMGFNGAELVEDGDVILHHCNTGALAAVDWGTALGVVFAAHEQGKNIHVLVDETRPRLQGARLTAWELAQRGISFDLIADNAAGHFM